MYKIIKRIKDKKKFKSPNENGKILNMAILMFIGFSFLNIFLIMNFISILNNIATI